jgi:hypothetical protein
MTRPWNPQPWLSEESYRSLGPAERRALFERRRQAQSARVIDLADHSRRRSSQGGSSSSWSILKGVIPIAAAAFFLTWQFAPIQWSSRPALTASGQAAVRTSFHQCKWGGGTNCVVDGDTIYLEGQKIRIAGIDAPETHDYGCPEELALGERSASRLQELLNGGAVSLSSIDRDEDVYGRKLRNAAVDGRDVGDTLIGEGLAREYAGGRRSWCG